MTDVSIDRIAAELSLDELGRDRADPVFADQDSGCLSYGVVARGHRWFVKLPKTEAGAISLRNCIEFHASVRHQAIIAPVRVLDREAPVLLYPWVAGSVLNHATTTGSDRRALERFQRLPIEPVHRAITTVLDAHRHIATQGFIAIDFYDGVLFFDFDALTMRLIDLDDYRQGPFTLNRDRLPGSRSYMAPEEFERGATIDQRTNVFSLGRMIHHLLAADQGWRGSSEQAALITRATANAQQDRYDSVDELTSAWLATLGFDQPTVNPGA